jgi:hypothetical protein
VKIALALFAFVGAVIGSALGYLAYAAGSGSEGAEGFSIWMFREWPFVWNNLQSGHYWWTIFGAMCGVALPLAIKLFRNSNENTLPPPGALRGS